MKIGILTHPLVLNYGGILQAYALQNALRQVGNSSSVFVIDRRQDDFKIKKFLRKILVLCRIKAPITSYNKCFPQLEFIEKYIIRTAQVDNTTLLRRLIKKERFNCIVFGSDQIWRADFNRQFNFDFWGCCLKNLKNIRSFSYAASISDIEWVYTIEETLKIKNGLKNIKEISVREFEAADMCKDNLNIIAKQLIDPTLLFDASFYDKIESRETHKPYVFVYWLGDQSEISYKLSDLKSRYDIINVSLRDPKTYVKVESWINLIKNAEIVFTDSYHGMVFSIIYHKRFIIAQNKSGGINRLKSLFSMIGYPQKLDNPTAEIDYEKVDKRLKKKRLDAFDFIYSALNE